MKTTTNLSASVQHTARNTLAHRVGYFGCKLETHWKVPGHCEPVVYLHVVFYTFNVKNKNNLNHLGIFLFSIVSFGYLLFDLRLESLK